MPGCSAKVTICPLRLTSGSAEREVKCLRARIKELDLKLAIGDWPGLPNELVWALFDDCTVALAVDVSSVSDVRRLSIEEHAISRGSSARCRAHHQIHITRMEAICDPPMGLVRNNGLFPNLPIARAKPQENAARPYRRSFEKTIRDQPGY